jgi:hypothetical protein
VPTYGFVAVPATLDRPVDTAAEHNMLAYVRHNKLVYVRHNMLVYIEYTDGPATIDSGHIRHAYVTGKRRHTFFLLAKAHRAAYFRKRTDWQYESERRVVVTQDAVEDRNGVLLCRVKPQALRYIILGPRTTPTLRELCTARAQQWSVPLLELRIGARTFTPFFAGADNSAAIWPFGRTRTLNRLKTSAERAANRPICRILEYANGAASPKKHELRDPDGVC